jgi:hypothetical protein
METIAGGVPGFDLSRQTIPLHVGFQAIGVPYRHQF